MPVGKSKHRQTKAELGKAHYNHEQKGGFEVKNLPEGSEFKKPSAYGQKQI